jgi:hypothetical protein
VFPFYTKMTVACLRVSFPHRWLADSDYADGNVQHAT